MANVKVCFVSNYINHHQIPFCNAMYQENEGSFVFIQTEPMEQERVQMGWQEKDRPDYVHCYYEESEWCRQTIMDCEVLLFGGTDDESYVQERLRSGKLIVRYSERLYKTGQWKAISPRGLRKKYLDHTRYRKAPVYLLCSGAYVASDFRIVQAYPKKMFCWGYFPETKRYDVDKLLDGKGYWLDDISGDVQNVGSRKQNIAEEIENKAEQGKKIPYLLWAARFIDWKHPERALEVASYLKQKGLAFHLDMIGGGAMEEDVKKLLAEYGLEALVSLLGYRTPEQVRALMEQADIFLMTSDRQEGWGAVANEAMNSGCVLVADHLPGAVPYLVTQGYNGLIYEDGNQKMLNAIVEKLVSDEILRKELGRNAYDTIVNTWNAENAAKSFMRLIEELGGGNQDGRTGMNRKVEYAEGAQHARCERQVATPNTHNGLAPCAPAPIMGEGFSKEWRAYIESYCEVAHCE